MEQEALSEASLASDTAERAANAAPAPQNDVPAAGNLLKAAREAAGLSIDEVSHALKLAPRQVQALEQQDFAALPARAFVRGFMRNYARLLNIDANTVLEALPPEGPQTISPAASSVKTPTRAMPVLPSGNEKAIRPQTWKWLLAAAVIAVVAAGLFFWPPLVALFQEYAPRTADSVAAPAVIEEVMPPSVQQDHDGVSTMAPIIVPLSEMAAEPSDSAVAPGAAIAAPATAITTETENKEVELMLRFTADSWTEVRDAHDKVLYSALAKGGSEKTLQGEPPFSLVFGNSDAVAVTLRGENVDLGEQRKQGVRRFTLE